MAILLYIQLFASIAILFPDSLLIGMEKNASGAFLLSKMLIPLIPIVYDFHRQKETLSFLTYLTFYFPFF